MKLVGDMTSGDTIAVAAIRSIQMFYSHKASMKTYFLLDTIYVQLCVCYNCRFLL